MKRILSVFLSLITVLGAVAVTGYTSVIDTAAAYEDKVDEEGNPVINYITKAYTSPEAKLKDMVLAREQGDYQLWIEEFTGEVAFVATKTGIPTRKPRCVDRSALKILKMVCVWNIR